MPHPYFDLATPIVIGHRGCAAEVPESRLLDLGVDGLVTNHPARLARLIEGRGDPP